MTTKDLTNSPSGSDNAERDLNDPRNFDDFSDQLNKAVSEGDQEAVDRLMAKDYDFGSEASPDANPVDPPVEGVQPTPEDASGKPTVPEAGTPETKATPAPEAAPAASVPAVQPDMAALLQEIHSLKSQVGRVNYLQTELQKLQKQAKKQSKAEPAAPAPAPATAESEKLIAKLNELDPDTAEIFRAVQREHAEALKKLAPAPTPNASDDEDDDYDVEAELMRVERVHPETRQILFGSGRPYWEQWKQTLTPDQREWATSADAERVVVAMNAFKTWAASQNTASPHGGNAPQKGGDPATAVEAQAPTPPEDPVAKERERKLQSNTPNKSTVAKPASSYDVDKMFSEMYEKIQKDNHLV